MDHDASGVVPGRYAGGPIVLHAGPTPEQQRVAKERAEADALAGRICAAAAVAARSECELLELVGDFDACGAIRWWRDVKSLAHWLGRACSMTPGVAREHVRVARTLRRMPAVRAAFGEGRLSYSKVREVTCVVDVVDESRLLALALTETASQLARMVRAFRAGDGTRIRQQAKRAVTWHTRAGGMLELRAVLPAEEGAVVVAALTAAQDQLGSPPDKREPAEADATPTYSQADALLDVARVFLDLAPEDRSGEDHRRLVSRAQRRALAVRDGLCEFPGCHQARHLEAHHRVSWARGGPTDLDNLVLLCRWHHTAVHEGGMRIGRGSRDRPGWRFVMPDGTPLRSWWDHPTLVRQLAQQAEHDHRLGSRVEDVTSFHDEAAQTIRPLWAGERFDLYAGVEALFTLRSQEAVREAA